MIVSIEPGYYAAGRYGIRIENLVLIAPAETNVDGSDTLAFESLTCCPIDLVPVDWPSLTDDETAWLDRYHAWVRAQLAPRLGGADRAWLLDRTRPVAEQRRARA
jgi:Xaa-Pro aminopeptidase